MRRLTFLLGFVALASTILAQSPGTFTLTGNMITARYGHTATLLADGRVLIAGGCTGGRPVFCVGTTAAAEIYDATTGKFAATGNMTSARAYHTATLLPDGRVLIEGGSGDSPASAELYDPSTGTFTVTGNLAAFSTYGSDKATLLADGRVLIVGDPVIDEVYDPGTGTFASTADPTAPHSFATATLLADGRVLLTEYGGSALYDPRAGTFRFTGNQGGFESTATLLPNGKVLVVGGNEDPGPDTLAEAYDSSAGVFTSAGRMMAPRADHTATLLPDGKTLITGGRSWTGWGTNTLYYSCCLSSAELYDAGTGLFISTGSMAAGRAGQTATLLKSGEVLIAGGSPDQTTTSLKSGEILIAGGSPVLTAELYHPNSPIPAPALLSLSGDGQGQGVIQHFGTTRIASADDPAVAGETLSIYLNGLADGSVIPPQVAIGGRSAEVTFFGNVAGSPGLNVVNIRMPSGLPPGPAVPVRLTYLGRSSNQVTIGVTEVALQQAVTAMKTAAGSDSLNFWQWAYYWQYLPAFSGAPTGFGMGGSISPDVMEQIIIAGGGDPLQNISAEQWVVYLRNTATVIRGVVNAASHLAGAIAPGELVIITGSGLGPAAVVSAAPDSDGLYAAQLAGTAVLVNGTPAPLVYTSTKEVEVLIPDSLAGGTAQVTLTYQGHTSASLPVPVAPTAPGIFTQDGTGQGYAVTINQKGAVNVPAHWEGDMMTLFLTGAGHATPAVAIYGSTPLPITQGPTPGVMQIKLPILFGTDCDFPVVFRVGDATTQLGVNIAVDLCI